MAYVHHPVRAEWLARRDEPVLEPGIAIVDAHHHLWDVPEARYLRDDLLADLANGHDVRATVYVQARARYRVSGPEHLRPVGEVEFAVGVANECATRHGDGPLACAGIICGADLRLGAGVVEVLDAMRLIAGPRLCGVRNSVAWHADAAVRSSTVVPPHGLMSDPQFRIGAGELARMGLTLDVWAYQTQLGEVFELARAVPATTVIVNHLGGPIACGPYASRRAEAFEHWRTELARLSKLDNIRLKIGGLGMRLAGYDFHRQSEPPSSADLAEAWRPYVETAITLFGAGRAMFESNFPVDKGMYGYREFWNACKRLTSGATEAERRDLYHDTAVATYKLALDRD